MVSQRKTIRHTIRDLLLAAGTAAEDRIETNRATRVWAGRLPAIVIYTVSDPADDFEASPRTYESQLRVAVECWTTKIDEEEKDDTLDDLIDQVELALLPQLPTLTELVGGNPQKSGYEGVQAGFDADGRRILAGARVTFRVHYYIDPDYTPAEGLAPFTLAHVEYDLPNGDPIDAIDEIQIPQ